MDGKIRIINPKHAVFYEVSVHSSDVEDTSKLYWETSVNTILEALKKVCRCPGECQCRNSIRILPDLKTMDSFLLIKTEKGEVVDTISL
jgi:hypothetical protein